MLQESRLTVSSAFSNNFSGQSSGHKGCTGVSVFMSWVIGVAEDMAGAHEAASIVCLCLGTVFS